MASSAEERRNQKETNKWVAIEAERVKVRTQEDANNLLKKVCETMNSIDQAKFFLNAYPQLSEEEKEKIYSEYVPHFRELNKAQAADKFNWMDNGKLKQEVAIPFIQKYFGGITKVQLDEEFATIDFSGDGQLSMIEFLLWDRVHPGKSVWDLASRTQINDFNMYNAQVRLDNALVKKQNVQNKIDYQKQLEKSEKKTVALQAKQERERIEKDPANASIEQEIIKCENALKKTINAAKDIVSPPGTQHIWGAVWWNARELAEKKMRGPQSGQKKA